MKLKQKSLFFVSIIFICSALLITTIIPVGATTSTDGYEANWHSMWIYHYNYKIQFSWTHDGSSVSIVGNSVSSSTQTWTPWTGGQVSLNYGPHSYFDYGCYCYRTRAEIHGYAHFTS